MIQKEIDRKCWLPQIASFQAYKPVAKIKKRAPKKPKEDPTGKKKSPGEKCALNSLEFCSFYARSDYLKGLHKAFLRFSGFGG